LQAAHAASPIKEFVRACRRLPVHKLPGINLSALSDPNPNSWYI
jgi:hypothetical protein